MEFALLFGMRSFVAGLIVSLILIPTGYVKAATRSTEASCAFKDLRQQIGPIRNQGNMGWCFANAAADLLTFKYRAILGHEQVSADYLALAYNTTWLWRSPMEAGGYVTFAAQEAIFHGLCPQSIESNLLAGSAGRTLKTKLALLNEVKTRYDVDGFEKTYAWLQAMSFRAHASHDPLLLMPKAHLEFLLKNSHDKTFALKFGNYYCDTSRIKVNAEPVVRFDITMIPHASARINDPLEAMGLAKMHSLLDHNNIIAVSYFPEFFKRSIKNSPNLKGGEHASIIAGRRWNAANNTCEVLLRNSWGSQCAYKNPELNAPGVCDAGNLWIHDKDFAKYLQAITYID
jgi:hypothetical protein